MYFGEWITAVFDQGYVSPLFHYVNTSMQYKVLLLYFSYKAVLARMNIIKHKKRSKFS